MMLMICKAISLGKLCLTKMIFFVPQVLMSKFIMMKACLPFYDDYIYESGFGEVMTLFSDESTISEEVPIDYENKATIYDDYCDETYAIKSSDDYIYKTCHDYEYPFSEHYSFNVETIYSIQVSYDTPTIPNEKNFAYVESNKISMLVDHEKNALGAGYIVEFIHDATENYYEGGTYACRNCNNIKLPLYVLKILKLCLFCLPMLVDYCSHQLFAHKIPIHRKRVRLKCACHVFYDALVMFQFFTFMRAPLRSSCVARGVKR